MDFCTVWHRSLLAFTVLAWTLQSTGASPLNCPNNVGKGMELSSMLAAVKKVWTSAFVPASEVRQNIWHKTCLIWRNDKNDAKGPKLSFAERSCPGGHKGLGGGITGTPEIWGEKAVGHVTRWRGLASQNIWRPWHLSFSENFPKQPPQFILSTCFKTALFNILNFTGLI